MNSRDDAKAPNLDTGLLIQRLKDSGHWPKLNLHVSLAQLQDDISVVGLFMRPTIESLDNLARRAVVSADAQPTQDTRELVWTFAASALDDARSMTEVISKKWMADWPAGFSQMAASAPRFFFALADVLQIVGLPEEQHLLHKGIRDAAFLKQLLRTCRTIRGDTGRGLSSGSEMRAVESLADCRKAIITGHVLGAIDWLLPFVHRVEQLGTGKKTKEVDYVVLAHDFLRFLGCKTLRMGDRTDRVAADITACPKGKPRVAVQVKKVLPPMRERMAMIDQARRGIAEHGIRYTLLTDGDRFRLVDGLEGGSAFKSVAAEFQLTNLKPADLQALALFKSVLSDHQDFDDRILALPTCYSEAIRLASA